MCLIVNAVLMIIRLQAKSVSSNIFLAHIKCISSRLLLLWFASRSAFRSPGHWNRVELPARCVFDDFGDLGVLNRKSRRALFHFVKHLFLLVMLQTLQDLSAVIICNSLKTLNNFKLVLRNFWWFRWVYWDFFADILQAFEIYFQFRKMQRYIERLISRHTSESQKLGWILNKIC